MAVRKRSVIVYRHLGMSSGWDIYIPDKHYIDTTLTQSLFNTEVRSLIKVQPPSKTYQVHNALSIYTGHRC